ncbi:MAG: hypothetical protein M1828_002689 [Chrysothrix sp. TS-e1954]|nr:MAG: hypothetical protein M1828_002689 [Chrysothrix sp. TS-e1954]
MPDTHIITSSRGCIRYQPDSRSSRLCTGDTLLQTGTRRARPSRIVVTSVSSDLPPIEPPKKRTHRFGKLAGTRDSGAIRFLRSVVPAHSTSPKADDPVKPLQDGRRASQQQESRRVDGQEMPGPDFLRPASYTQSRGGFANSKTPRGSLTPDSHNNFNASNVSLARARSGSVATLPEERPVASGNGMSVNLNLAEPVLFLQGFDHAENSSTRNTAMLRGHLHLKVQKSVKIKAVSLRFRGLASTKWPEGIPPKKIEFAETDTLMSHTWPFFNAQFPNAANGTGADVVQLVSSGPEHNGSPYLSPSPMNSSINVAKDSRLSLSANQPRSFEKGETSKTGPSVAQKGYRIFHPGEYIYNFELPLDSRLPETIDVELGSVKYELEASVERAGAFRTNLYGQKEVKLIRAPAESSLEQVEPIAISRNWEDQLHYDIVISGKSFPLGAKIPIAFKLTPLAKVQCHRIKVFVTENIEYFCSQKRVHRMEPTRKVLLYEKRADGQTMTTFQGSSSRIISGGGVPYDQREAAQRGENVERNDPANLLGRLEENYNIGPTEMEFTVQLPGCQAGAEPNRLNKLHFDTTYQNIQVHHWIKIVMRLSKPDAVDPNRRRHFEISIDSPFHILSCRASQANTALPAYSSPESLDPNAPLADCGCPGAPQRRISPSHVPTLGNLNEGSGRSGSVSDTTSNDGGRSRGSSLSNVIDANGDVPHGASATSMTPHLARPQPAHVHSNTPAVPRPMHMLRAPSFNPPAFEEEQPPPPLVTPPPQYNDIASPSSGLADYFTRLANTYDEEEEEGEEDRGSGRVEVPLTPGGSVSRSFEMRRTWVPAGR